MNYKGSFVILEFNSFFGLLVILSLFIELG